ncbi:MULTISPECIES: hypothetical protein [Bacillus]|uniref:hypothetical protein n=1 Tax=Bacillus TaxID=1386 RepID=UPI0003422BE5|nr:MULTISPECIES: hypothetical protein [Bacillus]KJD53794.1 hypothetical protein UZ38_30750 [Bacillus amyloliquefaciens]KUL08197.1 hypothetical protein LI7559_15795 [Bacillus licheniformis LMG 7559]AGN35083.1 hypothetical protein BaLi_c06870 [Bacillus paralicheniformis ATCC 9945a]MCY8243528.1 hypothetical protein [Bacillus haynesii]MCY8438009.1 hypothetical protein [Bacillus haynesii]
MRSVKSIIFVVGLILANYVGGIPQDARNLFITQTIFFSPYLVDFYPILKKLLNRPLKILAGLIWAAGISILLANILGITGIITIIDSKISFVQDYVSPISLNLKVKTYLLIACVVYTAVFVGSITLNYTIAFDEYLKKKKMNKKQKQHASNKEVVLERG